MPASAPATVGPYELIAQVGEGGMGVVHLARDPHGREVAVKLLRPHVVGDEHGRARLAREVTSLRRVRSPRVAEVYDADPWGDMPYLVTRYVPGPALSAHVDAHGPLAVDDLYRLASGLAEALVAVHAADVLHRDVKPGNVLLEGSDPVLIDFGLAQLADDSRLTYSGWLLGTPGYLAPEILYGGEPSTRADVHSWAACVVFAATGRGPYGKGPAVAVMDRVRRGEHDLSGVPDWLYWPVRAALMPDPGDRPTAQALAQMVSGDGPRTGATAVVPTRASLTADTAVLPRVPRAAPWSAGRGAAASPPMASMVEAPRPPGSASALCWLAALGAVVALAVTAPALAAAALALGVWSLSTLSIRAEALTRWRQRRGHKRNDSLLATICLPWFAAVAFPGSLVVAVMSIGAAAATVVALTLLTQPRNLVIVLAVAAVGAGLMARWGPRSARVRAGGRHLTSSVAATWSQALVTVACVVALCVAVLVVRQVGGAAYAPLPQPPWEQHIRDLVPSGLVPGR